MVQRRLRRVLRQAGESQYGAALRTLMSIMGVLPGTAEERQKLQEKHPSGGELSAAERAELAAFVARIIASYRSEAGASVAGAAADQLLPQHQLTLSEEAVRRALVTAPRGSAGGGSGWLLEVLRCMGLEGGDRGFALVRSLLTIIARGQLPERAADALGACVLIGLAKGASDVRPIAIGECLHRMAFRAICIQFGPAWCQQLAPMQFSVMARDGAAQLSLAITALAEQATAADQPFMVIKFDVKNAYNEVSRSAVFAQLRAHHPELVPAVCGSYLRPGVLHCRGDDGAMYQLESRGGVRQGDPIAGYLFAAALDVALRRVQTDFGPRGVYVFGWADDGKLVGPPEAVYDAFLALEALLPSLGLRLAVGPEKNVAWSPSGAYPPRLLQRQTEGAALGVAFVSVMPAGITLMGLPLGGRTEQSAALLRRFQDPGDARSLAHCLSRLRLLARAGGAYGPAAALALLRVCAVHKVGYALRLRAPDVTQELAAWADQAIQASFAAIVGFDREDGSWLASDGAWRLRRLALPARAGGCGLTSAVATAGVAFYGAFFSCAPLIVERCAQYSCLGTPAGAFTALLAPAYAGAPPSTSQSPEAAAAPSGLLPFQSQISELRTSLASAIPASAADLQVKWEDGTQPQLQARLTKAVLAVEATAVREAAGSADRCSRSVLVFDAARQYGAGAFLHAAPTAWAGALQPEELVAALRRRLRLPFPELRSGAVRCNCCGGCLVDVFGDHAEACSREHALADSTCHNLVRDALEECAREAGLAPEREARGLVEDRLQRPADVYIPAHVSHGLGGDGCAGLGACVDVAGVRSLAPSAVNRGPGLLPALQRRRREKASRAFPPSAAAIAEATVAAGRAAAAALEAGNDAADVTRASSEAYARVVATHAPRWFVVPFVFSSLGFMDECSAQPVLQAMAARYSAREESGGADGVGSGVLRTRWLPRLSAAIERGAWRRLRGLLRAASGTADGDVLPASELTCLPELLRAGGWADRGAAGA